MSKQEIYLTLMENCGYLPRDIAAMTLEQQLIIFNKDKTEANKRVVHCNSLQEARKLMAEYKANA